MERDGSRRRSAPVERHVHGGALERAARRPTRRERRAGGRRVTGREERAESRDDEKTPGAHDEPGYRAHDRSYAAWSAREVGSRLRRGRCAGRLAVGSSGPSRERVSGDRGLVVAGAGEREPGVLARRSAAALREQPPRRGRGLRHEPRELHGEAGHGREEPRLVARRKAHRLPADGSRRRANLRRARRRSPGAPGDTRGGRSSRTTGSRPGHREEVASPSTATRPTRSRAANGATSTS